MYGQEALKLIQELKRSTWLPKFNDQSIRIVCKEIVGLFEFILQSLRVHAERARESAVAAGLLVHNACILRNKRCVLAYLVWRANRIRDIFWETGIMPESVAPKLGAEEQIFFNEYGDLVNKYMQSLDLNILQEQQPPKDLYVQVRVNPDQPPGEIMLDSGSVHLEPHTTHYLRRSECELLIRQGSLEQLEDRE